MCVCVCRNILYWANHFSCFIHVALRSLWNLLWIWHKLKTSEFLSAAASVVMHSRKWIFWVYIYIHHMLFSCIAFKIHILSAHTVLGNQTYDLNVASVVLYCLCYRNAVWNSVNSLLDTMENIFRLSITLPMES